MTFESSINTFILLIYFNNIAWFLPRDAMRKRGLCCRPVSVRPSRSCIVSKLLSRHGSPIILVFLNPSADTQFQGNSFSGTQKYTGVGKLRFLTEITVYLGNRTI